MQKNSILHGDCLELMKDIPDKSIDMILCDLPYGTTACRWDTVIPFSPLWEQYERLIKDHGAIVLTASQPFTSALVMSHPHWFKYEWIWEKTRFSNQMLAKIQPLKVHESVLVFGNGTVRYFPQNLIRVDKITKQGKTVTENVGGGERATAYFQEFGNYPRSIQKVKNETGLYPTQKPTELFAYFIETYTQENDLVLDNCLGSGTT